MKKLCLLVLLLVTTSTTTLAAPVLTGESEGVRFQLEEVVGNLGVPWGLTFVDQHRLLMTERQGNIKLLDLKTGKLTRLDGLPEIAASGQGGLMDISRSPEDNGWLYFTYSKPTSAGATTTLARAKLSGYSLKDWQDLLIAKAASGTGRHFGSRIAFDGQGHLFFSIGDRGVRPNGQNLQTHAGTILRLTLDGALPADNPFVNRKDALPEIWSYGHRNPQGLVFDRQTKRLWSIEHGPRGGDEINLIQPGLNYGWAVVSHGKEYWAPIQVGEGTEKPGMENPAKVYIPSIAPGSLLLYHGKAFPHWRGDLFSGALKLRHLNRVTVSASGKIEREERLLTDLEERIRALAQSPEGWIYLSTDSGRILRLRPVN